jgi:tRNA threonylcarbamoyladenosine biosynthesis protein TsaE
MRDEESKPEELSLILQDVAATEKLGSVLANVLQDGTLILLQGDLGVGKTSLVRGVLRQLGHTAAVKSPTYTLLEEYSLAGKEIIHFDLYRLSDPEELDLIGIRDYFNGKACCFVEWPDRGKGYLPPEDLVIRISHRASGREARLTAASDSGREIIASIQTALDQESG